MKKLSILLIGLLLSTGLAAQDLSQVTGDWEGSLSLPTGASYRIVVHINEKDGQLSATMDSPDQNVAGIPIDKVTYENKALKFSIAQIQGSYDGKLEEGKMIGKWSQAGQTFDLNLEKKKKDGSK